MINRVLPLLFSEVIALSSLLYYDIFPLTRAGYRKGGKIFVPSGSHFCVYACFACRLSSNLLLFACQCLIIANEKYHLKYYMINTNLFCHIIIFNIIIVSQYRVYCSEAGLPLFSCQYNFIDAARLYNFTSRRDE